MVNRTEKPATIDEQVLDGDHTDRDASAALRVPKAEPGPEPPEGAEPVKEISQMSEMEKRKWRQYEHERKAGEGDHHFTVRIVWNFLPKHPWNSDLQYETYIEKLDWREIQFAKRHVHSGSKQRNASIKWILPQSPAAYCRTLATKFGKSKEVNQLYEYLLHLQRQYASTDESRLTAEEIVDKYEMLFRDSNDVSECIRLGEMIVKFRNLDLRKGQEHELTDADDEDLKAAQNIVKMSQGNDTADPHRPKDGGGLRVLAPASDSGAEGLPPERDPAV